MSHITAETHGLHHFFADPADFGDTTVRLVGDEARHAVRVLRVRAGERITVADGSGRVAAAIVDAATDVLDATIVDEWFVDAPRPALTLFQALTKSDRFDDVVEKATEIGVARIIPFIAQRTVVKWDAGKRMRARERWLDIARAAAKQSRSPRIPAIDDVANETSAALDRPGSKIVLHEAAESRLRDVLPGQPPADVVLLVGPEGGFSDVEVSLLASSGADVASLGGRVLRAQTAGVVAAAIVGYAYGNIG